MAHVCGLVAVVGRILLALIFLASAISQHIPHFSRDAEMLRNEGLPIPAVMLAGAIACMLAGGISIVLGLWARLGAFLLLVFLLMTAFVVHDFWNYPAGAESQGQMAHFMKNLSMAGAMLLIMAQGPGPMSIDRWRNRQGTEAEQVP